jgi:cell division protein FtsL
MAARFFSQGDLKSNRGNKRRVVDRGLSIGPVSIRFITIALVTILSIIYLAQSNLTATKGYELKQLQKTEEEIRLENERLEVEASRLKALKRIKQTAKNNNMVDVEQVDYPDQAN